MEIGRCPACDHPYTSREVVGLGILRARPEHEGGPFVEYRCARCDRQLHLVPHGSGRYAPPGAPVPEEVPPEERTPAWVGAKRPSSVPPDAPPAEGPPAAARPTAPPGERSPPRKQVVPPPGEDEPLTLFEALRILGIGPTADREAIERAFRDRSVQCHPDKVAHLDAEFQALAERKFRRLREAYEMLTR